MLSEALTRVTTIDNALAGAGCMRLLTHTVGQEVKSYPEPRTGEDQK